MKALLSHGRLLECRGNHHMETLKIAVISGGSISYPNARSSKSGKLTSKKTAKLTRISAILKSK